MMNIQTVPWEPGRAGANFALKTPVSGISASAFSVILNAGYGVNGIFISNPSAIEAISALRSSEVSTQDLLDAFNRASGLPKVVAELRLAPYDPAVGN